MFLESAAKGFSADVVFVKLALIIDEWMDAVMA